MTTIAALWLLIFALAFYCLLFDVEESTRYGAIAYKLRRNHLRLKRKWAGLIGRPHQTPPDYSARAAYWYLGLLIPALACVVFANWKYNAFVNDTLLLVSSLEMAERFSSLFSNANANPLQALFDIMPSGLRNGAVPTLISQALFGTGMQMEFFYIFCGALLAFATAALGRAADLRWGVAVSAGIIVPFLILPTFGMYPLAAHFYVLWPIACYSAAGALVVMALFWSIDGRYLVRAIVFTAVNALILVHLAMTQILFMSLFAPAYIAMGVGALAASRDRKTLLVKLASAGTIVVALLATGIFHYMYAIGVSTAPYVFYEELPIFMQFGAPSVASILADIGSVIINPFTYDYAGRFNIDGALAPLSQLGAIYLAVFGRTRTARIFGWSTLGLVVGTAIAIPLVHNFHFYTGLLYRGPDPRHFIPMLLPYYMLCLASLILALADKVVYGLSRFSPKANISTLAVHAFSIVLLSGPIVLAVTNQFRTTPFHWREFELPFFRYFQRNAVVDYLERETRIEIDRDFRGTVVSMPTVFHKDLKPYHNSQREWTFWYARSYLGNDFGAFGLKHFNIPTIDQMTHNVTPQFYLTVRELLSRPGIDQYDRHFALVTRLNEPIMALLGLRYIIADYALPFGTERVAMPIPEDARKILEAKQYYKSPIRVYELPDPNLGNYSPTEVVSAKTAADAIAAIAKPTFNGRQTFTTDDETIGGNLVAATNAKMTVRLGGVAVAASSTGQSVLVLPVQYSHCWRITSGDGATLFRANLMQLGIRFNGQLDVELRQIFGPFWQSACRVKDAEDAARLRMADARGSGGWKAP